MRIVREKLWVVLMVVAILLPNCPCKLLQLFGYHIIESGNPSTENQTAAELVQFDGTEFSLICHCGDEERTFKVPANGLHESLITTHLEAWCAWSHENPIDSQLSGRNSQLRAPPDKLENGNQTLSRDFLCSYLT